MFSQDDIDAVLRSAEEAVDALAEETGVAPRGQKQAAAAKPVSTARPPASQSSASPTSTIAHILSMRVPVIVRLAERSLPMREVMKLAPGSIVEFDRGVDADLDLLVNNHMIGSGEAIKVGEHFGLRITNIRGVRQRLQSAATG